MLAIFFPRMSPFITGTGVDIWKEIKEPSAFSAAEGMQTGKSQAWEAQGCVLMQTPEVRLLVLSAAHPASRICSPVHFKLRSNQVSVNKKRCKAETVDHLGELSGLE